MDNQKHPSPEAAAQSEDTLLAAEHLLRLERRPAPEGFAERVLARAAAEQAAREAAGRPGFARRLFAAPLPWAVAATLALAVGGPAAWTAHTRHVDAQGRRAAAQFELAIRLTQAQLAEAGERAATWHNSTDLGFDRNNRSAHED